MALLFGFVLSAIVACHVCLSCYPGTGAHSWHAMLYDLASLFGILRFASINISSLLRLLFKSTSLWEVVSF